MEPEAKYAVVGAVVVALVALLAATVVWLRASGQADDSRRFKIYFARHSLEGLEERSYVTMRGIRVGAVTGFRFSAQQPGTVEVFIAVQPGTPVRERTKATVQRHLVTGIASVVLVNENEDSALLQAPAPGEDYPVIAEGESRIEQVSESLTALAVRADRTMQRLNALLSPDNEAAVSEILENLRSVSGQAQATLQRLDSTLGSLGGAAEEIRTLARTASGDAAKLAARYDELGAQANTTVREAGEALARMSADVERLSRRADALLASGDEEMRVTAQSLRGAADSVNAAAARLRDPRDALFGPSEASLGPGEARR